MNPIIYGNTVLFSRRNSRICDGFMFFNKTTGKLINLYEDATNLDWISGARYQYKNFCVITNWYDVFLIDLSKNEVVKQFNLRDFGYDGQPRIGGLGEWVYIPVEIISNPRRDYGNTWIRWNMLTDEIQEVVTIEDQGTFDASFESLAFWMKPDGDTVMIFQNRQYDFTHRDRRIDLYGYNMTKGIYEWKVDSFTVTGNTSIFPILIEGDRLYFQGSNEAFCFDCRDGHQIWNRYFPGESFFITNAVLAEGKYILKSETVKMFALDKMTGQTVWENQSAGVSSSNMIYHNGFVYYETGEGGLGVLRRIWVQNGNVNWTYFPSNYKKYLHASFGSDIVLDPETNIIYCNDRIFHMGVRLPG